MYICGVLVIDIENGNGNPTSNLGQGCLQFSYN